MLGKKSKTKNIEVLDKIDSIIGKGSCFTGNITSEGIVRIDGSLIGDIEAQGDVYIGEKASVEGNIKARNLFVGGYIKGSVEVAERLELNAVSQLYGSITVGNLIIEEGAIFKGDCMTRPIDRDVNSNANQEVTNNI